MGAAVVGSTVGNTGNAQGHGELGPIGVIERGADAKAAREPERPLFLLR